MEILKYHNDMNTLRLGHLTEKEVDIFFSLIVRARDSERNIVIMEFSELKELADGDKNNDRFIKNIQSLSKKLKAMTQEIKDDEGIYTVFSLFGDIIIYPERKMLGTSVDSRFLYLIKDVIEQFTLIDLKELVSLKSGYSKTLYRLLKQWNSVGKLEIDIEKFRELLGIPENYKTGNIDQKVLDPALEELKPFFPFLKLQKIKKGVKVASLKFSWRKRAEKAPAERIEPIRYRSGVQKDIFEEIADRQEANLRGVQAVREMLKKKGI